jgi:ABC-type glutathione transport system ATPase component
LSIQGGEFAWEKDAIQPTLEDINITVKKGQLLGVLGRVGAGKVYVYCDFGFGLLKFCRLDEFAFRNYR